MAAIQEYVRQCLSHRLYIYYFLMNMFGVVANAVALFGVFLNLSLGITLKQLAMINTGIQFVMLMLNYPAGALADRFHPMRITLCMYGCLLLVVPLNFVWMFGSFPADRIFHVSLLGYAADLPVNLTVFISLLAIGFPIGMLQGASADQGFDGGKLRTRRITIGQAQQPFEQPHVSIPQIASAAKFRAFFAKLFYSASIRIAVALLPRKSAPALRASMS